MLTKASLVLFASTLFAAATVPACASRVALEDRPCPCADGWTCCASRNVCVAPGTACPSSEAGAAPDAAPEAGEAAVVQLARGQSARCLAFDSEHVYWQNANGLVVGAPKARPDFKVSSFQTPLANNARCGLAIDGASLYTTSFQYGKIIRLSTVSNGEWAIGGEGSIFGALSGPSSVLVDPQWIWVTEYEGGRVSKIAKSGPTDAVVVATGMSRPDAIVGDADHVYWINRGTPAGGDGSAPSDGAIMRLAKSGGEPVALASNLPTPNGLALHGGRLFWTDADGRVSSIGVGGEGQTTLATREIAPGPIAADAASVYWGTSDLRSVARGGGPVVTAFDTNLPVTLALDDTRVYWASTDEVWSALKTSALAKR
ncbi:MAG: hypothetical protein JNL38_05945 [Myxococcales bacterium]|nr:hypothetical protein [Myxococcales bacterium]